MLQIYGDARAAARGLGWLVLLYAFRTKPYQKEAKSLLFVTIWLDGIKKGSFVFVLIKRTSKHFFHTRIIF